MDDRWCFSQSSRRNVITPSCFCCLVLKTKLINLWWTSLKHVELKCRARLCSLRVHSHQVCCSIPCRSTNIPRTQIPVGLHSHCPTPSSAGAPLPPSHTSTHYETTLHIALSHRQAQFTCDCSTVENQNRLDCHCSDFATLSFCSQTASIVLKWLQRRLAALAAGHVQLVLLCLCTSNCTVPWVETESVMIYVKRCMNFSEQFHAASREQVASHQLDVILMICSP